MIPLRDRVRLTRWPLVTIGLIAANVLAYLLSIAGAGGSIIEGPGPSTIVAYGAIPYEFTHLASHCALAASAFSQDLLCSGQPGVIGTSPAQPATWETALTAMFLHANALQIAVNMMFLAVFGATLEDTIGRLRFLAFYLLGGLAALALSIAASPHSVAPTLGASGALAAVLGGYILLYPRARILTAVVFIFFFNIVEVPAWVMLGLWLTFDAVLGALGVITPLGASAGVAYYAHLGGLAFGLLAVRTFAFAGRSGYEPLRTA